MNHEATRRKLLFLLMVLVTLVVCSTAVRIEVLNAQVGGFLPRPQPPSVEGNNIKWRTTGPSMVERMFRTRLLFERGIEYTDEARDALVLTPDELRRLGEEKRLARLDARFRSVVSSMGLLQYSLVPAGIGLCFIVFLGRGKLYRAGAVCCAGLFVASGVLMMYREYWPSLGW
ncbi:hypothetical protein OT109_03190 [Phycisphaeraceae bacterium D3-23]